jgi:Tfp pilus assembly protein PilV
MGFSLLEVLMALAILLFALIGIGRLLTLSGERAMKVQQQGRAAQLCQAKLAEVAAGVVSLSSQSGAFDEDPDWQWTVDAESDSSISGLWRVKVTVSRNQADGSRVESSLNQMVLDPSLRGSTTDTPSAASTASSSSNGAGSGTAGGASSGQGGAAGGAMPAKPQAAGAGGGGATTPKGGSPGPAASPGTSKQKPGG